MPHARRPLRELPAPACHHSSSAAQQRQPVDVIKGQKCGGHRVPHGRSHLGAKLFIQMASRSAFSLVLHTSAGCCASLFLPPSLLLHTLPLCVPSRARLLLLPAAFMGQPYRKLATVQRSAPSPNASKQGQCAAKPNCGAAVCLRGVRGKESRLAANELHKQRGGWGPAREV